MRFNKLKKFSLTVSVATVLSFIFIPSLHAQTAAASTGTAAGTGGTTAGGGTVSCVGVNCLPPLLTTTNNILAIVNTIPAYLNTYVTPFILNLKAPDDSDQISKMQASFATLGQTFTANYTNQLSLQQQLMASVVNQPLSSFTPQGNNPATIMTLIPNINDLAYSTMLGLPPVMNKNQPFTPNLNYVTYTGGANLNHVIPNAGWQGTEVDRTNYKNYYNSVVAVESFNSYALSNLYTDLINGNNNTTTLQNSLIAQASNSAWLIQVASEEIGKVLREILIFQSQSYVLLSQLLQTQKQLLTATVMTNTLLILNNRINENYMTAKAQGAAPKP